LVKKDFVTIIIPIHNRIDFLLCAVDSVLAQSYENFEIIIVEDGETNKIKALVDSFTDPRIRFYQKVFNNAALARNYGASFAKGKFIAFLDDDDFWEIDKLQVQLSAFRQYPDANFIFTDAHIVSQYGERLGGFQDSKDVIRNSLWYRHPGEINSPEMGLSIAEVWAGISLTSGLFFNRDFFDRIGRFDGALAGGQDVELTFRANRLGRVLYIDQKLFSYRLTEKSISRGGIKPLINAETLITHFLGTSLTEVDIEFLKKKEIEVKFELGYRYFYLGRLREARLKFYELYRKKICKKYLFYYLLSFVPHFFVKKLRKLKECL